MALDVYIYVGKLKRGARWRCGSVGRIDRRRAASKAAATQAPAHSLTHTATRHQQARARERRVHQLLIICKTTVTENLANYDRGDGKLVVSRRMARQKSAARHLRQQPAMRRLLLKRTPVLCLMFIAFFTLRRCAKSR